MKTERDTYSWDDLVREKCTSWSGVRNFQARNNLRAMETDDMVLVYHSGDEKAIKGIAKVVKMAYPDATATEGDWCAVDISPVKSLVSDVPLNAVKRNAKLKTMVLVTNSRLSVQPVDQRSWDECLKMAQTSLS